MRFFSHYFNSLKSRIIVSAAIMVVIILPIVAIVISNAYQKHMNASVQNELVAYSYSILAVAEVEEQQLLMPEALVESRFNTGQSGLYALITSKTNIPRTLWRSSSLIALVIPQNLRSPAVGAGEFYDRIIDDSEHFVYSFSVSFLSGDVTQEMTLHIIKQQQDYQQLMNEFNQQLLLGLLVLMLILIMLQFIWLKWSLKPLVSLKREIANIEQGKAQQLIATYPEELQQLTTQLNVLLTTEQNQRKRYRNALSDLAHSLKTPLAVLQGQISTNETMQSQEQIDAMNLMIEHQLKRAQSAGQSSWHLGVNIAPCTEKLLNSLQKIYRDKDLTITQNIAPELIFKGDETDLLEMLGNVLDNACKAANQQITISAMNKEKCLVISIEDDGCGIKPEQIESILQRGTRADTYQQGHGIGLAIVRDLIESYQGQLQITQSKALGGAKFTLSFNLN